MDEEQHSHTTYSETVTTTSNESGIEAFASQYEQLQQEYQRAVARIVELEGQALELTTIRNELKLTQEKLSRAKSSSSSSGGSASMKAMMADLEEVRHSKLW
jgi:predicted  nucleic acid-binding Zn-ribbon protein